jgi:tyrosyl-tRNA synthetase
VLSPEEVQANAETYLRQFFKVVDKSQTEIRWQSEWFSGFTLNDVISIASKFTVSQLLAREDFQTRQAAGRAIALTELLYPLLQAYDSVMVEADVEFGGIDQKFNCLIGRELQRMMGQCPQQLLLTPLLVGTDGKRKMSKSLDNYIAIEDEPDEMYGKVMSLPDHLIMDYFELVTDVPDGELEQFKHELATNSVNPMKLKKRLAYEIVSQFHSKEAAEEAEAHFEKVFQKRELPEEIPVYNVSTEKLAAGHLVSGIISEVGLASSRSEAKRLIAQGAIEIDGVRVTEDIVPLIKDGSIIRVGKRKFIKLVDANK